MKGRPAIILRFKSNTTALPPPPRTADMSSSSRSSSSNCDEGAATATTNNAKRKRERDIPIAIGGGKGNLFLQQPQQKRARQGSATVKEKEKEEKRVLRSQDVEKRSEYEEWFEEAERGLNDDIQIPILRRDACDGPRTPTRSPRRPASNVPTTAAELLNSPSKNFLAVLTNGPDIANIRNAPIQIVSLEEELQKAGMRPPRFTTDPLVDSMYTLAHTGAERLEKRSKNIERDLLHHNAARIEGDLEKLRGPEWWKAIGLSQAVVAACSKKELVKRKEPLVKHLEATLEKYKAWNNSEKRKKNGRTSSSPKDSQERESYDGADTAYDGGRFGSHENGIAAGEADGGEEDGEEDGDEDDIHLHRISAKKRAPAARKARRTPPTTSEAKMQKKQLPKPVKPEPVFTSFYDSPSARLQAISNNRRKSSRMQTAFGVPLPVMEEKEFELPEELLASTSAARHARARKRLSR